MEDNKREARQMNILQFIQKRRTAEIETICEEFAISQSTARRILTGLEREGQIRRFRGGAIAVLSNAPELPVLRRTGEMQEEKRALAQRAVDYIRDGDTILLTAGSTIHLMCGLLDSFRDLTVLTDSILVLNELMHCKNLNLIMLGGQINTEEQCTYGFLTVNNARSFKINTMFTSVKAISLGHGFMTDDMGHMPFYRNLMELSDKVIVLADHSKLYQNGRVVLYRYSEVDRLLTGDALSTSLARELQSNGCNLELCPVKG